MNRAAELRRAFDDAFARPRPDPAPRGEAYLAVSIGEAPLALPIRDLAALAADRRIEPVPGGPPGLLGLAGIRGRLVAVHDLGLLLGIEDGAERRWLAVWGPDPSLAFAFPRYEGRFEAAARASADHVLDRGVLRGVIDLALLVSSLEERST